MSGGSFDYVSYKMRDELDGRFYDRQLNDMFSDLCDVAHELEWFTSGDTGYDDYRRAAQEFKDKWFKDPQQMPAEDTKTSYWSQSGSDEFICSECGEAGSFPHDICPGCGSIMTNGEEKRP